MVRHIIFWKYLDEIKKEGREEEAFKEVKASFDSLKAIPGVLKAEFELNADKTSDFDMIYYSEFPDMETLNAYKVHPLHLAHKERCKKYVGSRTAGDIIVEE